MWQSRCQMPATKCGLQYPAPHPRPNLTLEPDITAWRTEKSQGKQPRQSPSWLQCFGDCQRKHKGNHSVRTSFLLARRSRQLHWVPGHSQTPPPAPPHPRVTLTALPSIFSIHSQLCTEQPPLPTPSCNPQAQLLPGALSTSSL